MSRSSDSASKFRKSDGEPSNNGVGNLTSKMNQLKRQIQAERVVSIKDKVEKNRRKLEADVSQLRLATSRTFMGQNGVSKMISLRIGTPLCKYGGFAQGSGDKDVINGHEVAATTGTKLPFVEKIPPYTTWIFLDKNQRMAEDQSVVGRRRIYYDQHGSEALICSDSEEDNEPEEEKHEFCDGEDRILWMVSREHGLAEEVLNVVSQFIGVGTTEIQERCRTLEEKYSGDQSVKDTSDSGTGRGISMEKSLSAALDSFDNLFCRRCLLFDCRLHGCSQTLINPSEKQSYWSEYEDDRKPCSDQCSLRLRVVKDLPGGSVNRTKTATSTEEKKTAAASDAEGPSGVDFMIDEESITEAFCNLEPASEAPNLDMSAMVIHNQEYMRKRKAPQHTDIAPDGSSQAPDDMQDFSKKKKRLLHLDVVNEAAEGVFPDHGSTAKKASDKIELKMTIKKTTNDSFETVCSGTEENVGHGATPNNTVPSISFSRGKQMSISMATTTEDSNNLQPPPPAVAPPPPPALAPPQQQSQQQSSTIPQYPEMIMAAVEALNEKEGSSKTSISKQIESTHPDLPPAHGTLLSHHLNKLKQSGQLVLVKNNYMKPDPNAPPKRGRGRPPKPKLPAPPGSVAGPPRPRGRPPKPRDPFAPVASPKKKTASPGSGRPRGRPPKNANTPVPAVSSGAAPPSGVPRGRGRPPKVKPAVAPVAG